MKFEIIYAKAFKKSFKRLSHTDRESVSEILRRLANDEVLEAKYNDHALSGNLKGCRDCHIKPDLVLIYAKNKKFLELIALNVGSHSELF